MSDPSHVLFPAVSEADSVVKVAEWQQTYYASDSGIQSGATTVLDDESSTEYSGRKKYSGCTSTSTTTAPTTSTSWGVGDAAAGGLESPSGETFYSSLTERGQKSLDLVVVLDYFFHFFSLHFLCLCFFC